MAVLQTVAVATVAAQVGGAVYRTLISKAAAGLVDTVQGVQQHVELPEVRAELTKLDLEATIGVVAGLTDAALDRYVARVDGVAPAGEDGAGTAAAGAAGAGAGAPGAPAAGAAGMRRAPGSTQALPEFDAVARAATDLADTLDETRTLLLELQEAVARNKDRWFKHLRSSPYASLLSQLRAKRDLIDSRLKLLLTALEVSQRLADARDRDAALAAATRTLPPAAATTTTALAPPLPLALPAPAVQEQEQAQEEEQQPPSEVAGGAAAADGAPSADDVVADFVLTSAEAAKAAVDAAVAEAYAQADSGGMPRTTTTTSTAGAAAAAPNDDNSSEPAPPLHREQDVPVTASQMFTAL